MKAEGYNAVTIYFDWAYHSPTPGRLRLLRRARRQQAARHGAQDVGLYVIARPGPYINAETSAGGLPGWLTTQAGKARTNARRLRGRGRRLADPHRRDHRAPPAHQRHRHGDPLPDRERAGQPPAAASSPTCRTSTTRRAATASPCRSSTTTRAATASGCRRAPTSPGTVTGPNDLYAFDGYPGGTCNTDATPGSPSAAPDWGIWGPGGATGGSSASPNTPGFVGRVRRRLVRLLGQPGHLRLHGAARGPGLRARLLRDEHRQPAHASRTST